MTRLADRWNALKKTVRKPFAEDLAHEMALESSSFHERIIRLRNDRRARRASVSFSGWTREIGTLLDEGLIGDLQHDKLVGGAAYNYFRFLCQSLAGRRIAWQELLLDVWFIFKPGGSDLKEIVWIVPGEGLTGIPWLRAKWSDADGDFTLRYLGSPNRLGLQMGVTKA